MTNNLISVIVPVYNAEEYLEECIDSVLRQTYSNFELIMVNDESTDNSLDIIKKYQSKDERIVVYNQKHQGVSSARNRGIEISKGEYLAFLDADDLYLSKDYLKLLIEVLKEYDADKSLVLMNIFADKQKPVVNQEDTKTYCVTGKDILLYKTPFAHYVGTINFYLFKRKDFDNIRFPEGYIVEDNAIIHRLLLKSNKIAVVSKELYGYRRHQKSQTYNSPHLFYIGGYYAYKDRIAYYAENNETELLDQAKNDFNDYLSKTMVLCIKNNTVDLIPEEIRISPTEIKKA